MNIETQNFCLRTTLRGHGWSHLAPIVANEEDASFEFVFNASRGAVAVSVSESEAGLEVGPRDGEEYADEAVSAVRRMLRLEEDLEDFHGAVSRQKELRWIADAGAGRLMRSPTVFEDVVKTICTTNCSWSLTKLMVSRLVENLGSESPSGKRAFPTPEAMALKGPEFYRNTIRAGYRSDYLHGFATKVASGRIDPEEWLDPAKPTEELKKNLLSVRGVGNYAAENMLKLLGRYESLALDSFLRSEFYKRHNGGEKCSDRAIEAHYEKFGEWRGLVIWFDMCGPG